MTTILSAQHPQRIVCLTEETTETLYLLGEQDRIVGISGFTVRPPQARRDKPKVSAFLSAKTNKILDLKPDLVIGFSDLQADIAAELVRQGLNVLIFNHRSVEEILHMILTLSSLIGVEERGRQLTDELSNGLHEIQQAAAVHKRRPTLFFEEWDDPLISGIQWVSELVRIAGADDSFPELSTQSLGKDRIIANPAEVISRNPDIIVGSWCGKKFRPEKVAAREGWHNIAAVRNDQLHEIKSVNILQPGPAALTDGVKQLQTIINAWHETDGSPPARG